MAVFGIKYPSCDEVVGAAPNDYPILVA
jgi:hypothetical protein